MATFSWTVTNDGTGATNVLTWYDAVYLSTDDLLDGSDIRLGQIANPSYLAPGDSYNQSLTAEIPSDLSGPFYAIVVTDNGNAQREISEDNNIGASTTTVPIEAPPVPGFLHVADVTVSPGPPATIWAGHAVTVTWTVENTGDSDIPASVWGEGKWDDGLALSPEPTWNGVDGYWIGGHQGYYYGALAVGESYTLEKTITLPEDAFGTWYVVAVPDCHYMAGGNPWPNNDIPRDQGSTEIEIELPLQPDLQVTLVDAPPTGNSGESIDVTWTVSNEGYALTASSSWVDSVYLSRNDDTGYFQRHTARFLHAYRRSCTSHAVFPYRTGRIALRCGWGVLRLCSH